jgi:hypothetical protein
MKLPDLGKLEGAGLLVGLGVAAFILYKVGGTLGGLLSGKNSLTKNATDWNGNPVTAYDSVPVLGTLGAAANAVTGGALASVGEAIGSVAFDSVEAAQQVFLRPPLDNTSEAENQIRQNMQSAGMM